MQLIDYESWIEEVELLNKVNSSNPMFLIMPILKQKAWFSVDYTVVDSKFTIAQMAKKAIEWPKGELLWDVYIAKSIERLGIKA